MKIFSNFIQKIKTNPLSFYPVVMIIFLTLSLSTYCLKYNPSSWFDEGIYIQIANNLSEKGRMAIQTAPDTFAPPALISVGYPVYYTVFIIYKIFGNDFVQARYASILYLWLFIWSFYALNKKMFNKKTAILATLLIISFAPLYGNGKNLLGEIPGLFFMTIGLIGYCQWEKNKFSNTPQAIIAGLGFGLAGATKPNFLVLGGGLLLALILNRKIVFTRLKELSFFLLSGLLPLLWWLYTQFSSVEIIKKTLGHYANPYAENNITHLILPNLIRFFTESTPAHFSILTIILITAIYIRLKRHHTISGAEIIIYFFIFFTLASYLRTPGWYRYFFLAHVWLIFLLPASIEIIVNNIHIPMIKPAVASTLLIIGIFIIQITHLSITGLKCEPTKVDMAGNFLKEWTIKQKQILLINTPELTARMPHNNYYQYLKINPAIEFGKQEEQKIKSNFYENIVLKATEKNIYDNQLHCYSLEKETGGYQFYTLKHPC